jgi:hypothetical protein
MEAVVTGRTFRWNVYLTIIVLLSSTVAALVAGVQAKEYEEASRSLIPVLIAVAAAWLTFCLQRRVAYTVALRSLWEKMVASVQAAIQYTHLPKKTAEEYRKVLENLGCRIDDVRGVFRNVGETYKRPSTDTGAYVRSIKHASSFDELASITKRYDDQEERDLSF